MMSAQIEDQPFSKGAGFFRRMGAWIYDALVLLAVEMLAIGLVLALLKAAKALGVTFTGYLDTSDILVNHPIIGPIFTFYVFMVLAGFYSYFWCIAGQTVGMKAWKLRIVNAKGENISPTQASIRLATSCLGIGNLLVLFDKNNRAFQDHFAHCQMVRI